MRREAEDLYPAIVTSDGSVSMFAPVIYISSCNLDMTWVLSVVTSLFLLRFSTSSLWSTLNLLRCYILSTECNTLPAMLLPFGAIILHCFCYVINWVISFVWMMTTQQRHTLPTQCIVYAGQHSIFASFRYFPWDRQSCVLKLGSWTYDSSSLKMHLHANFAETGQVKYKCNNISWRHR